MKILLSLILISYACAFSQNFEIKYLKIYTEEDETSLAVLTPDEETGKFFTIEFDIKSEFIPNLNIVFRFCDRNWIPYKNLFLINTGEDIAYDIDFETLPSVVEDADYHFKGSFPNNYDAVTFPFSGKWMFFITDSQDTSVVYASGKFFVVYNEINMNVTLKREQLEDKVYFPSDLAKIFNITSEFYLGDKLFPNFVDEMEIVENQKIYYPIVTGRKFNTNTRQFYWDGSQRFSFTARDIRPGNEYRHADFTNVNKFTAKDVRAQFDGLEYSRFFQLGQRDLNGGSKISRKYVFPTYLNVTFSVRPPEENFGSIFLVGAFNDWIVTPEYELENNGGVYTKTVNLKRGAYDYQYVAADLINGSISNENWYVLEGNTWETSNIYHVFIYYSDPNYGGWDKIIGYKSIISK